MRGTKAFLSTMLAIVVAGCGEPEYLSEADCLADRPLVSDPRGSNDHCTQYENEAERAARRP